MWRKSPSVVAVTEFDEGNLVFGCQNGKVEDLFWFLCKNNQHFPLFT